MMLPPLLVQQLRHMEWADALLWTAVLAHPAAHSDTRLRELLHHTHLVQHVYLQVWRGEPFAVTELDRFADLEALHDWARDFHAGAERNLAGAAPDDAGRAVEFPWAAGLAARYGTVRPATLEESVVQVVLHSAHHRAQLCTRLRELGGEPPLVDFIAWIWSGRPAAAWDAAAAG